MSKNRKTNTKVAQRRVPAPGVCGNIRGISKKKKVRDRILDVKACQDLCLKGTGAVDRRRWNEDVQFSKPKAMIAAS